MRQGDMKPFVPFGVLGVGEHARAGKSGLGNRDRDIRVAGNDLPVVVELPLPAAAPTATVALLSVVGSGPAGIAGSETAAQALGDEVHVGKTTRLEDMQLQISMQVHHLLILHGSAIRVWFLCGRG